MPVTGEAHGGTVADVIKNLALSELVKPETVPSSTVVPVIHVNPELSHGVETIIIPLSPGLIPKRNIWIPAWPVRYHYDSIRRALSPGYTCFSATYVSFNSLKIYSSYWHDQVSCQAVGLDTKCPPFFECHPHTFLMNLHTSFPRLGSITI